MMVTEKKEALIERIEVALNTVRPYLAVDGGNIEVIDVTEEMVVQVKWLGNCKSCSMSTMTMRAGIEAAIIGKVPEITGVEAINGMDV